MRDAVDTEFAARFRRLRRLAGLTQEAFGKKLGVSHQAVRAWEQGHLPRCQRWAEIAQSLSTTAEELFLGVQATPLKPDQTPADPGRFLAGAPPAKSLTPEAIETLPEREVRVGAGGSRRLAGRSEEATRGPDLLLETQARQGRSAELLGNHGTSGTGQRAADFGQRLRALRRAGGYSMAELAARLGVTWQAIQIWEKGESLPRPDLWGPVAAILGTTVPELLHGLASSPSASSKETDGKRIARLVVAFATCDWQDQDLLIHQAERLMQRD